MPGLDWLILGVIAIIMVWLLGKDIIGAEAAMPWLDWLILGVIVAIAIMVWALGREIIGVQRVLIVLGDTLIEIQRDVETIRDKVMIVDKYDDGRSIPGTSA